MDRRPSGARRLSYRVALWTVGLVLVLHATPSTRAVQPAEGWRLTLGANISGVTDQGRLTLGAVSEAAIELDDRDEPHPPALPSRYVDVYTEHNLGEPGWSAQLRPATRYRTEFGPPLGPSSRVFEFVVETDQSGVIDLSWDIVPDLDLARHFLSLRDLESEEVVDMWEHTSYSFPRTGAKRRFRVEMTAGRSAPPVAYSQSALLSEDASLGLTLMAEDPQGDPLVYEIVGAPLHGVVTGTGANVTYNPAPDYFGPDAFTFRALDSQGASNVATVSLVVTPVNDAPSAVPQAATTNEDEPAAVFLTGTDPDGDPLYYSVVAPPSHGTIEGSPPGLTYRPDPDFSGTDSFLFMTSDGTVQSAPALVSLTIVPVNDPPRAAFTVPGEAANVAVWDNNLASFFEGASASASSQSATAPAANAIDDNPATRWASASGQVAGQNLTVTLPGAALHLIGRVRLVNPSGTTEAIRHFEVAVSATSADASAFSTVMADLALNDGRVQEFAFATPLSARFVMLRALDNYGSSTAVSVASFEVVGEDLGGVPAYTFTPGNLAAAADGGRVVSATSQNSTDIASQSIDGNAATRWTTATGQRTNQALVVELAREKTYAIDRVRILNGTAVAGQAMKKFSISVSTTTPDPLAFVDVLSTEAANSAALQEFVFPGGAVPARYVRLIAADNYESACCISLGELQVVPAQSPAGSVSSGPAASERVEGTLDASLATGWRTAVGQVANQFLTLRLQAGRDHLIDRVRLASNGGASSIKDFTILVSSTTDADAAFEPVLAATLANNQQLQEFIFPGGPIRARYIKLFAKNNYLGTSIQLSTFQVITAQSEGSVVSIPAPISQLARNESPAQAANGALVVAFSSAYSSGTGPIQMLDYVHDDPWATNGLSGQFALIRLARRSTLTGVRVSPRLLCCPEQSVRNFEIWTSDTGAEDADFSKALSGTVLNNDSVQTFELPLPRQARYVKYVPLSSYGSTAIISTTRLDVIADGAGGVVAASSGPLTNLPELALDGNPATVWRTAIGSVSSQWVTVLLSGGLVHRISGVRISPETNTGPKAFEVRISTASAAEADFVTVASGQLNAADSGQEIAFAPVDARYVQFRWLSGHGASFIGVRDVEVIGSLAAGAVISGVSSAPVLTSSPAQILDPDGANGVWTTATGQVADQWLTLTLPGDDPIAVDRIALQGQAGLTSPREFEVQVSTTTTDPAAFSTAFAGALRNDGTLQNYFFDAVAVRHLRLLVRSNYGAATLTVQNFKVYSPEYGEVQARFIDQSTSIDGRIEGRTWEFGDGGLDAQRDPPHAYPASGVYEVRLSAAADTGVVDEIARPYRAAAQPAVEFESYPTSPREGQAVVFIDATDDPSGVQLREWTFGDGGKATTAAPSISHTFVDNGAFSVTLKVTNTFGLAASFTRQVVVSNVTPTVSVGANRRALAGEALAFTPTITDPGADPPACSWDFGDGSGSSGCSASHTYVAPSSPTDDPIVFTAVLTVNDGDGGVASSSLDTEVFPQRMGTLATGLAHPIGIDWSPDSGRFVVANNYPNDQLVTVLPSGVVSPVLVPNLGSDEVNVVVSPGLGGFARGGVYHNLGRNRQLARLRLDPSGSVTQVESPWVTQVNAGTYGGITFDTEGGFGYDLLVVWQHGVVYRVNSSGQSTQIATLQGGEFEGATVAGHGFGPASGCLLTVSRLPAKVWAVCPTGAPFVVVDMSGLTQNQTSWIRYVPAPGSLVFSDYEFGRVLRGDPRMFGAAVVGHAIISTEYMGEVWDLSYDAAAGGFKTRLLALAPRATAARLEDITFVPAHAQLAPAAAAAETGNPHSVQATIVDEAGFPMVGLPVRFAVAGANPTGGEVATDDAGVATFTYTGLAAGPDTVSASSFGLATNAVSVVWSGNAAPIADPQSIAVPGGLPTPVALSGVDPEGASLTFAVVEPPLHGALSGAAPFLTYTPSPDYVGTDSFSFKVVDAIGAASAPAVVSIVVMPVNVPPAASDQSVTLAEDGLTAIVLSGQDPENGPLTFTIASVPQHGTISGTAPSLTYTPAPDYNGTDSFAFTVTDASGATSEAATVSIVVTAVNDAPTGAPQAITTNEDNAVSIALTGSDVENEPLTFAIASPPQHGTIFGTAPSLTYMPAGDYNGPDSIAFTVTDASGATSNAATVSIIVNAVNDAPTGTPQTVATLQDTPVSITLAGADVESASLTFTIVVPPQHGTLSGAAPNLTYTPALAYSGADVLSFVVADEGGALSPPATVSITVTPVQGGNAPPVCTAATAGALVWPPNHRMVPLSILGVTDPEGGSLIIKAVSIFQDEPVNGTGDGDTSPDGILLPLQIRSERQGNGNGRVYTIQFSATDPLGASCSGVVRVCVPKSQSGQNATCGDGGPLFDSTGLPPAAHRDDHHCDKVHAPGDHCDKDHSDKRTCTKDHRDGDDDRHLRRGSDHSHDRRDDGQGRDR